MFNITFTLKQHTPLIHFQHDQQNATLRASEVKPKLDRFLIDHFKRTNADYLKWSRKGKVADSLDYQLKLVPRKAAVEDIQRNPLYFGNMGDAPPKHFLESESLEATIVSYDIDFLSSVTETLICEFFLLHNFSTRQSKGFGSFYPIQFNKKEVTTLPESILKKNKFRIEIDTDDPEKIYATIDYFWKWLKSGVNYGQNNNKHYRDSILKLYVAEKTDFIWEKKRVKEIFLNVPPDNNVKYFVRPFLGLADNFTYKPVPTHKQRPGEAYVDVATAINIKSVNEGIERVPSPVTFVPFVVSEKKTKIYLVVNDTDWNRHLINQQFKLSVDKGVRKEGKISTPKVIPGDINTLLDFAHEIITNNFEVIGYSNNLITKAKFIKDAQ